MNGRQTDSKFDIRAYSYAGQVQLLAARETTCSMANFST
jgi:hypothetical protein